MVTLTLMVPSHLLPSICNTNLTKLRLVNAEPKNIKLVRAAAHSEEIKAFLTTGKVKFLRMLRGIGNIWSKPEDSFEDPCLKFATLVRTDEVGFECI